MNPILSYVFLLPLAVHTAWIMATHTHFPAEIGGGLSDPTPVNFFVLQWLAVTVGANLFFIIIHWRLPNGGKTLLSVPNREWWLADPDRKAQLVSRLRGVVEVSLFCMNLFFLGVYQYIYQGNVHRPIIHISDKVLIIAFVALPVLFNLIYIVAAFRRMVKMSGADPA